MILDDAIDALCDAPHTITMPETHADAETYRAAFAKLEPIVFEAEPGIKLEQWVNAVGWGTEPGTVAFTVRYRRVPND